MAVREERWWRALLEGLQTVVVMSSCPLVPLGHVPVGPEPRGQNCVSLPCPGGPATVLALSFVPGDPRSFARPQGQGSIAWGDPSAPVLGFRASSLVWAVPSEPLECSLTQLMEAHGNPDQQKFNS